MSKTGLLSNAMEEILDASIAERPNEEEHAERALAVNGGLHCAAPMRELDVTADDLQRMQDIADGLEALRLTTLGLEAADPSHVLLAETCLNLSYAGTPHRAYLEIPSMEGMVGQQISLEASLGRRVIEIMEAVTRALSRTWRAFMRFLDGLFDDSGALRFQLETVEVRTNQYQNASPKREQVKLGASVYALVQRRQPPADSRPVLLGLMELRRQLQSLRQHYVPMILGYAHKLQPLLAPPKLGEQPSEDFAKWIGQLNEVGRLYNPDQIRHWLGTTFPVIDGTQPNGAAFAGPLLPGSRKVVVLDGARLYPDKANGDYIDQATILQAHSAAVVLPHTNPPLTDGDTMPTLSADHLQEIVEVLKDVIREVQEARGLRGQLRSLEDGFTHAIGEWKKLENANLTEMQIGLRYATVTATRITRPYIQMLEHAAYVCQAALTFCRTHLAAYR